MIVGGILRISGSVLNEASTIHSSGASMMKPPRASSTYRTTGGLSRRRRRGKAISTSVLALALHDAQLHEGHEHDDEEQQHRRGGRVAHLERTERLLHDEQHR